MHEDKLEHDERLRLECLAQAIQSNLGRPKSTVDTLKRAAAFEAFVRNGVVEQGEPPYRVTNVSE